MKRSGSWLTIIGVLAAFFVAGGLCQWLFCGHNEASAQFIGGRGVGPGFMQVTVWSVPPRGGADGGPIVFEGVIARIDQGLLYVQETDRRATHWFSGDWSATIEAQE